MQPMLLVLTCADRQEAQKITDTLLEKRLVVCVKFQAITSHFIWQGAQESADEILLLMETFERNYDAIYAQVKQLHSYQTFVLLGMPITRISDDVRGWMQTELRI